MQLAKAGGEPAVVVAGIASALPDTKIDNDTIARWSGLDPAFVEHRLGIRSRRFLEPDESAVDLASAACRELFDANDALDPSDIGVVVVVTQNPDAALPHVAALLQAELALPESAACFDVALGCSGWVYALSIAAALLNTPAAAGGRSAIVVTCDPYSRILQRADREVVGLFGDAATATWLRVQEMPSDGRARIGVPDFGTDGSGARHLATRADGTLTMNGRAVFNFMLRRVPESIERCLTANSLSADDIDLFVFHQASRFMLTSLAAECALPADRVPILLTDVGNTVSSSIPLALATLEAQDRLRGRVLVSGFGVGLSWATNVLTYGG